MESNHYAKTPGGGVTLSPALVPETLSPCQHINGKGHRCHMFTSDPHSTLCGHHLRKQIKARRQQDEAAADELLDNVGDFSSAASVNAFLANLVKQLARKRIARHDAVSLAYISQLLLNSLSAIDRQSKKDEEAEEDPARFLLSLFHQRDREDQAGNPPDRDYENHDPAGDPNAPRKKPMPS